MMQSHVTSTIQMKMIYTKKAIEEIKHLGRIVEGLMISNNGDDITCEGTHSIGYSEANKETVLGVIK